MSRIIIKRAGHDEAYDERKAYASVYSALLATRESPESAELISAQALKELNEWLDKKTEVSSKDIHMQVGFILRKLHPRAYFLYHHHKILF